MMIQEKNIHLKAAGKATGTFYFKQFKVEDGRSTMKVGTDAVLLGARVEIAGAEHILEIGTGCGVIALILAQRSKALIDAIDIDEDSVNQANENVIQSTWNDRIKVFHNSLQDFTSQVEKKYDLVVSNPPYFSRSLKSPKKTRNISRHNDMLSFEDLLSCSTKLMTEEASLWVILPVKESEKFVESATRLGLFAHSNIKLFPKDGQCQHRNIFHFKKTPSYHTKKVILNIKNADGTYSDDYIVITKDFYLDL
jgi:tRNA1Val (adenine37-N6)-methyltransferase